MTITETLQSILTRDLSGIIINSDAKGLEDFPEKKELTTLNEHRLLQIVLARRAIIEHCGLVGEEIDAGNKYLNGDPAESNWIVYDLYGDGKCIAVLWSEYDDGSYSVFFKGNAFEIDYIYYEN